MRLAILVVIAVLPAGTLACSGGSKPSRISVAVDSSRERGNGEDNHRRDLEAMVLENYSHLSLNNVAAYSDSVSRESDVTLIGVGPRDFLATSVSRGDKRGLSRIERWDPRPLARGDSTLLAKNLDLDLSSDEEVGWVFDAMSIRFVHAAREASIPFRYTALFVREIDRWVMVLEHTSYAMPIADIVELAAAGKLPAPAALPTVKGSLKDHLVIRSVVSEHLQDRRPLGGRGMPADGVSAGSGDAIAGRLIVLPGYQQEYRAAQVMDAPSLVSLFGEGASVELGEPLIVVASGRRASWVVSNLRVTVAREGIPLVLSLRGTFVLTQRGAGWDVVQTHISAPVSRRELSLRALGDEL